MQGSRTEEDGIAEDNFTSLQYYQKKSHTNINPTVFVAK